MLQPFDSLYGAINLIFHHKNKLGAFGVQAAVFVSVSPFSPVSKAGKIIQILRKFPRWTPSDLLY